jgi:preprotein translocase subunit SecY
LWSRRLQPPVPQNVKGSEPPVPQKNSEAKKCTFLTLFQKPSKMAFFVILTIFSLFYKFAKIEKMRKTSKNLKNHGF